jgi:hypothetical protein
MAKSTRADLEGLVKQALGFDQLPRALVLHFCGSRSEWLVDINDICEDLENRGVDLAKAKISDLKSKSDTYRALASRMRRTKILMRDYEVDWRKRSGPHGAASGAIEGKHYVAEALIEAEKHRALSYTTLVAFYASREPSVLAFRANVLRNVLFSEDAVESFLHDPRNGACTLGDKAAGTVQYIQPGFIEASAQYLPESSLARLAALAQSLVLKNPWKVWAPAQAVMFILTNQPPIFWPIAVRPTTDTYRPLGLFVAPWVSATTVANAYRIAQRRYLPEGRKRFQPKGTKEYSRAANVTAFYLLQHMEAREPITDEAIYHAWQNHWTAQQIEGQPRRREIYPDKENGGIKLFRQDLRRGLDALQAYI